MARLSLHLPPFAGDYSGACSVLFGMDCLVVVVDAGCCARNYAEYDETRWKGARTATFSAQLRTLDVLLGDDSEIVRQTVETARELGVTCAALVGTPVPALVGMDVEGMAREVEAASGIPTLGIATTGFETYEAGVACALEALARKFALGQGAAPSSGASLVHGAGAPPGVDRAHGAGAPPKAGREAGSASPRAVPGCGLSRERPRVNVLGATPHDFMTAAAMEELEEGLRAAGLDLAFSTASAYGAADVAAAAWADASVVVSTAGLSAVRLLREACGVPCVVGRPFASEDFVVLADRVRAGDGRPLWDEGGQGVLAAMPAAASAAALGCAPAAAPGCAPAPAAPTAAPGCAPAPTAPAVIHSSAAVACASPAPVAASVDGPVLLVGEQVAMCSLRAHARRALRAAGAERPVVVASFFGWESVLAQPGDVRFADEEAVEEWLRAHPGAAVVGDPLLRRIPQVANAPFFELPHEAVSSTLFQWHETCARATAVLQILDGFAR